MVTFPRTTPKPGSASSSADTERQSCASDPPDGAEANTDATDAGGEGSDSAFKRKAGWGTPNAQVQAVVASQTVEHRDELGGVFGAPQPEKGLPLHQVHRVGIGEGQMDDSGGRARGNPVVEFLDPLIAVGRL